MKLPDYMVVQESETQYSREILYVDENLSEKLYYHYPITPNYELVPNKIKTTKLDGREVDESPPEEVTKEVRDIVRKADAADSFFKSF